MEAEKSRRRKIIGQFQRPENQEGQWCQFQSESTSKDRRRRPMSQLKDNSGEREFFLTQLLILFRPSVHQMRPPILQRAMCFTQSTDSNVHLIQKHPQTHLEIMFSQSSGHKIHYHKYLPQELSEGSVGNRRQNAHHRAWHTGGIHEILVLTPMVSHQVFFSLASQETL